MPSYDHDPFCFDSTPGYSVKIWIMEITRTKYNWFLKIGMYLTVGKY